MGTNPPAGVHERPTTLGFAPGAASLPPPGSPPPPGPPDTAPFPPPGGWGPELPPPSPPSTKGGGAKIALIVVTAVAVLLLGVGGAMTYLWVDTSGELDQTRTDLTAQVEALESTVGQRDGEINDLQGQLDTARDDLQDLETQLEGSQNEVEFLEDANTAISLCLDLINEWLFLIATDDIDAANDLFDDELEPACDEADQYR